MGVLGPGTFLLIVAPNRVVALLIGMCANLIDGLDVFWVYGYIV